ncbi:DUF1972 domain-containing protein [Escherichia albertii]|nr:DUF1972 domain-containing protein [Escherichia albertii]
MIEQFSEKKVDVVGIVGLPACYGGFESLVQNLVDYQSKNVKYTVYCSRKKYKKYPSKYKCANLRYVPFDANGGSSIFYDIYSLFLSLFNKIDVVLILGVSGCIFLPIYKFFSSSKIITNIDGLEWKREKWTGVAKWYLKLSEKIAVKYSDVVVADNEAIAQYVLKEYGILPKVIAYGGDHSLVRTRMPVTKEDYFFTVCRIEPENNIRMILEAFENTTHRLKIVGNWNSSLYGRRLKEEFGTCKNIEIIDSIYDADVLFNLRSLCRGYIHGHSAGGTNPSLVEAMHFQTPIIAFDCNFNRFTTDNHAFYFKNKNELSFIINDILNGKQNERVEACAKKMKEIASKKYTWNTITKMYEELY